MAVGCVVLTFLKWNRATFTEGTLMPAGRQRANKENSRKEKQRPV
jgi:hypothetical protein